jgi:hypothetical protein
MALEPDGQFLAPNRSNNVPEWEPLTGVNERERGPCQRQREIVTVM